MPRFSQLSDWLTWLESLHPTAIDLGLARVYEVACRLQLVESPTDVSLEHSGALAISNSHVITIAGTNGKGSCVATLSKCFTTQNYSVGTYTSPHLHHYCERIHINGKPVDEQWVCDAFAAIDEARGDISLTYFEFGTLAALWIFVQQQIPYVVLEVGLGGRLDAVNIVDADIAIVTSIAVDHEDWLGNDKEKIALEKLGIARDSRPVIITEVDDIKSLKHFTDTHDLAYRMNRHFSVQLRRDDSNHSGPTWLWAPDHSTRAITLPLASLPLPSVAAALQALHLSDCLPSYEELVEILNNIQLTGRYQVFQYKNRELIFDVAHNPAAAAMLASRLQLLPPDDKKMVAVFAVMGDKEISTIIDSLSDYVEHWYIGGLKMERAASVESLASILKERQCPTSSETKIEDAFELALAETCDHDRIMVFGSFFTVAAIQEVLGLTS